MFSKDLGIDLGTMFTRLADGIHTREQIVDELVSKVQEGQLVVQQSGEKVTDPQIIRHQLQEALDQSLKLLARQGLLVANP